MWQNSAKLECAVHTVQGPTTPKPARYSRERSVPCARKPTRRGPQSARREQGLYSESGIFEMSFLFVLWCKPLRSHGSHHHHSRHRAQRHSQWSWTLHPRNYLQWRGRNDQGLPLWPSHNLRQRRAGPGSDSSGRPLWMPQSVEGAQGVGGRQEQSSRTSDYEIYNTCTRKHDIHGKRCQNGGEGRGFAPRTVLSFQITIATPGII